jgi:hypothetical protein
MASKAPTTGPVSIATKPRHLQAMPGHPSMAAETPLPESVAQVT